jgi:hypothetical protein
VPPTGRVYILGRRQTTTATVIAITAADVYTFGIAADTNSWLACLLN